MGTLLCRNSPCLNVKLEQKENKFCIMKKKNVGIFMFEFG